MNLLLDENVDIQIVERLRDDGHSVSYVAEMSPSITDQDVLQIANKIKAPLVTSDKDFGEIIFRQHLVSYGIILIRLSGLTAELKADIVSSAIKRHADDVLGYFTVISKRRIRIRKIPVE